MSTVWIVVIAIAVVITIAEIVFPMHVVGFSIIRDYFKKKFKRKEESQDER